jgi:hypothetical protein
MNAVRTLIVALGLMPALVGAQAPQVPSPEQFQWNQPVLVQSGEALYRFDLPETAYTGMLRSDLGDLRLFNGGGEPVPFALLRYQPPAIVDARAIALPHFQLHGLGREGDERLELDVRRQSDGSLIALSLASGKPRQPPRLSGYVFDASGVKHPMAGLSLDWQVPAEGTVASVAVDASDDLQTWRCITSRAQLVDLSLGETRLRHKRIELHGLNAKYLRLRWAEGQEPIALMRVSAEIVEHTAPPEALHWSRTSVRAGSQPGEYLFDSAGLPVQALRFALPQPNTVAPLRLFRRDSEKQPWRELANTVAYRLSRKGREANSPDMSVARGRERYWRVLVNQRGGGIGSELPGVELGWVAQQAVFVARGSPPYTLAYGQRSVPPADFDIATLVPGYQPEQFNDLPLAQLGSATKNPKAAAESQDINWRTLGLWSLLILGVAMLAGMAWRLMRQMAKDGG